MSTKGRLHKRDPNQEIAEMTGLSTEEVRKRLKSHMWYSRNGSTD